jgi:NADPH2:quinone reductase
MRAIVVENAGPDYRLVPAEVPQPAPGPGDVLIKVAAAGVNHADLLQARGAYPPPPGASDLLGLEVSGTIVETGEEVDGYAAGEGVCALLAGGGYAEYCVAPIECILPIPHGIDPDSAASLPEAYFTVWTNLFDSARLMPGERVLIHGGSSGIGTAAIQLCAARGHEVFTTAGTPEKCAACEKLGAKRAIDYRKEDFVEAVKQATGGKGVAVVLDMVGGDYIERNFHALAVWGRLINIAFQHGPRAEVNFAPMLMKRLSFMATTLRSRSNAEKGAIRDAVLGEVWPLIDSGKIKPVIDQVFPLGQAQSAHAHMAKSEHIGKILLKV